MSEVRLPAGGKAWFVRKGNAWCCSLTPASTEGRVLTAVYALWIGAMVWLVLGDDPGAARLVAFLTLVLASTFLYILTALRMSARAQGSGKRRHGCS